MPAHALTFHVGRSCTGQALDKPQGRKPRELRRERCHGALLFYGDLNSAAAVTRGDGSVTDPMMRAGVVGYSIGEAVKWSMTAVKNQRWVAQKKSCPHRQEPMTTGWARVGMDYGDGGHGGARGKWWRARMAMMIIGAPQCGQRKVAGRGPTVGCAVAVADGAGATGDVGAGWVSSARAVASLSLRSALAMSP